MLKRIKNPDVTKALANIVWLGLERLTQIAVAIAISGLLARYFGPDVFGHWQHAAALPLAHHLGVRRGNPRADHRESPARPARHGARQRVRIAHGCIRGGT